MRKKLFVISLLFLSGCGLYTKNHREFKYNPAHGNEIKLQIHELEYPLSKRTLIVHGMNYPLKGRDCEDAELKNFSNELWAEIARRNDLSGIEKGSINLLKRQGESVPEMCRYFYFKKNNGEWTADFD